MFLSMFELKKTFIAYSCKTEISENPSLKLKSKIVSG